MDTKFVAARVVLKNGQEFNVKGEVIIEEESIILINDFGSRFEITKDAIVALIRYSEEEVALAEQQEQEGH